MTEQEANCSRNECLSSAAPETRAAALLRGIFSVPEVQAQLRGMLTEQWAGVCRDTARAPTEPRLWQPCQQLPAAYELTPRSCWFRGAWAQSCLALIAGLPAQAFWRGYSELGNYLDMIKLKRSFRKIAIGNERASTGDPGSEKMSLLTIPSLINVQIHVPNWAFASSLLFKQIGRHRKGWIYETAIRMKTFEQQKISARNLQATWFSFSSFSLIPLQVSLPTGLVFAVHTGIEHRGPGGCFWAISAIYCMGSFPSRLPLLIRLKFYSKPIQHYQLENFAS